MTAIKAGHPDPRRSTQNFYLGIRGRRERARQGSLRQEAIGAEMPRLNRLRESFYEPITYSRQECSFPVGLADKSL